MLFYTLFCDHVVKSEVLIRKQYHDDEHYVFCPSCRALGKDVYAKRTYPSAWQKVVKVTNEMPMSDASNGDARFVLGEDFLRVQPSVPGNRVRPFPYRR